MLFEGAAWAQAAESPPLIQQLLTGPGPIIVLVVAVMYFTVFRHKQTKVVCSACGSIGYPKKRISGSPILEILLWLLFLLPGLIYTLWRHANQHLVCRTCGQASIIPVDSPIGRKISSDLAKSDARITMHQGDDVTLQPPTNVTSRAELWTAPANYCSHCGAEVTTLKARFCKACGAALAGSQP